MSMHYKRDYEVDLTDFLGRVLTEAHALGIIDDPLAWMPGEPGEHRIMGLIREATAQRDEAYAALDFAEERVKLLRVAMEDALCLDDECCEPESEGR